MVEQTPHYQEIVGSNPASCWAFSFYFSFPSFYHQWGVLNQVPQGGASLAVFCDSKNKIGCLAVLLGAKHAQYAQIGLKIYNLIMELVLVLSSLSR